MTNDQILDDLNYASALAREGASAPLVGGRIGLMWGCLLSITLTLQWAILSQALNLPLQTLFYVWFAFAAIGGTGIAVGSPGNPTSVLAGTAAQPSPTGKSVMPLHHGGTGSAVGSPRNPASVLAGTAAQPSPTGKSVMLRYV